MEIAQLRTKQKAEMSALQAQLRREQLKVQSLEKSLEQKVCWLSALPFRLLKYLPKLAGAGMQWASFIPQCTNQSTHKGRWGLNLRNVCLFRGGMIVLSSLPPSLPF